MGVPRHPTMRQVALSAGVSIQTVSRVIHDPTKVSVDTRLRVESVIAAMGYSPNATAQTLRSGRSNLLGVVINGSSLRGPSSALACLIRHSVEAGMSTFTAAYIEDDPDASHRQIEMMLGHNIDSAIVIAAKQWAADEAIRLSQQIPVVVVQTSSTSPGLSRVCIDQHATIEIAFHHLRDQGAERIAYIGGPNDWFDGAERNAAWNHLARTETEAIEGCITTGFLPLNGYQAAEKLLKDPPDAIVCASDLLALGAQRRFLEAGIRCPEDILFIGVDNSLEDEYIIPSLSSINQPLDDLARVTIECTLDLLDGQPPRVQQIIPSLIIRESTTPVFHKI